MVDEGSQAGEYEKENKAFVLKSLILLRGLIKIEDATMISILIICAFLIGLFQEGGNFDLFRLVGVLVIGNLCFAASNMHNQLCDINEDRIFKKERPLASGVIRPITVKSLIIAFFAASILLSFIVNLELLIITFLIIFGNFLYSSQRLRLKNVLIARNFIVAFGFGVLGFLIGYGGISSITHAPLWILVFFFMNDFFSNVTKDLKDYEMHLKMPQMMTLPKKIGIKKATLVFLIFYEATFLIPAILVVFGLISSDFLVLSYYGILAGLTVYIPVIKDLKRADQAYYLAALHWIIIRILTVFAAA